MRNITILFIRELFKMCPIIVNTQPGQLEPVRARVVVHGDEVETAHIVPFVQLQQYYTDSEFSK